MSKKTRKHCRLCQHEDREELEDALNALSITPDELDKKMDWPSGATSRHMRNHIGEYEFDHKAFVGHFLNDSTKINEITGDKNG